MANVLLIDPPWYVLQNIKSRKVSYGLASLAAVLKENRHNCVIYDGDFGLLKSNGVSEAIVSNFDIYKSNLEDSSFIWHETKKKISRILINFNPSIVGITIPTAKYFYAVKIANYIKREFPHIIIVAGGPHPTIQPLETLGEHSIDIVVKGEGEHSFLELVNAIGNVTPLENIFGIAFKSNSKIIDNPNREYINDIDSLPFPAWNLTHEFTKHKPGSFGAIFTSRGCPYRCIFCASHKIWGRRVRYMSADRVIAELRNASQKYRTTNFRFNDDTFILDQERVIKICEGIKKSKINIEWQCDVRADLCNYEILKIMKSAGCSRVNIGIESGNHEILKYIEKEITLDQIYKAVAAIKKARLSVMAYFMVGFPPETIEQIEESIKLMDKLKIDYPCWSIVTPYPGTKLYDEIVEGGLLPFQKNWSYFFHHSPVMHISKRIDYHVFLGIIAKIQKKINRGHLIGKAKRIISMGILHPIESLKKAYRMFSVWFTNILGKKF